ncbi:hypothetical protein HBI43_238660 [Parastagonospora nodorum]|nr:hypothetical protein HBI43_238660 [Parastagonospora nodorum]
MHCVLCNISKDTIITKVIRELVRLQEYICTANARCIVRGLKNSASASLLVYSNYALQKCSLLTAYALNYLKLQVLKLTLIGTVLYNAIKEYYDDRIRKTIYFYSYTIEKDYNCVGKREDNILTIDKCRTSYSNKEDIEADEREEETRVRLRKLLGEIHDILLREFHGANDFIESITYNDDEQKLELEDYDALVERYEEEINCSNLYSTM